MSDADNVIPFPHGRRAARRPRGGAAGPAGPTGHTPAEEHEEWIEALPPTPQSEAERVRAWARDHLGLPGDGLDALRSLREVAGFLGFEDDEPRRPQLLSRPAQPVAFVVRLDLDGASPPIWRRLRLAGELTLEAVHEVIQLAMGWGGGHLHHFVMGPKKRDWTAQPFLSDYDVAQGDEGVAEQDVRLDQVVAERGDRLFYEYDFGDGGLHTLKVERVEPWAAGERTASCLDGRRACPPEDIGGLPGYRSILDALAGRPDPQDAEWLGQVLDTLDAFDPEAFDAARVDADLELATIPLDVRNLSPMLAALLVGLGGSRLSTTGRLAARALASGPPLDAPAIEAATARYRALLDAVGEGLALTAAGYLPPKLVEQLYRGLEMDDEWWGKGNREDQTYPVYALRTSAISLGLLRKNRGRLLPTKAGQRLAHDPAALLRHIADRLPLGREAERTAGLALLVVAAAGADGDASPGLAGVVMQEAGWSFTGDAGFTTYRLGSDTRDVLDALTGRRADPATRTRVAAALLRR